MSSGTAAPYHVVAVPYPGRGHINAMLNLCRLLVSRHDSISATVVVTEEWLGLLGGGGGPATSPVRDHPQRDPLGARARRRHGRVRGRRVHANGGPVRAAPRPARGRGAAVRGHRRRRVRAVGRRHRQAAGRAGVRVVPDQRHHVRGAAQLPAGFVLYVSLGSYLSVSSTQLDEIAAGLAESKAKILWVVHDAGGRCRVQGKVNGLVVPWTDQLRVLCHPSIGGFFTHCGMNSTLESLYAGVSMLTLPITFDQPVNSRLIVEVWKIGYGLKEKARADGVISRQEIAAAVERLMRRDTAEAEDMRRRARLMKVASRATVEVGGSWWRDITSFISFISQ
ncbi:hypothetical protein QOZ80_5AG0368470 [Eleusine coracana subsp. coracana]|nr:hypothetical protein QOZ80_5AG0368470 [Eleusine coracana subsp. coracana]